MEELSHLNESSEQRKSSKMPNVLAALLIALTVTSCGSDRLRKIDGKILDQESRTLTRWDTQRRINREWNTYIGHLWQWDDEQILELEGWTHKRSVKNRKRYNRWIKKLNRLLKKRDRIRSKVSGHLNYQYDEHEFENSDQAIREALDIEFE